MITEVFEVTFKQMKRRISSSNMIHPSKSQRLLQKKKIINGSGTTKFNHEQEGKSNKLQLKKKSNKLQVKKNGEMKLTLDNSKTKHKELKD